MPASRKQPDITAALAELFAPAETPVRARRRWGCSAASLARMQSIVQQRFEQDRLTGLPPRGCLPG